MFPTDLARMIASGVGLHPTAATQPAVGRGKSKQVVEDSKRVEKIERLKEFQRLALVNTYEISIHAYFGMTLTKDQTKALNAIYDVTKAEAKSTVIERLMNVPKTDKSNLGWSKTVLDRLDGLDQLSPDERPLGNGPGTKGKKKLYGISLEPLTEPPEDDNLDADELDKELLRRGLKGLGLDT